MRSDDVPIWLQVFWKFLLAAMTSVLVYVMVDPPQDADLFYYVVIGCAAFICLLAMLFTKLGEE